MVPKLCPFLLRFLPCVWFSFRILGSRLLPVVALVLSLLLLQRLVQVQLAADLLFGLSFCLQCQLRSFAISRREPVQVYARRGKGRNVLR